MSARSALHHAMAVHVGRYRRMMPVAGLDVRDVALRPASASDAVVELVGTATGGAGPGRYAGCTRLRVGVSIPYPPGEPLTCTQIRELDVLAIEHVGIPGLVLMENAGRSVAELIYDTLLDPRRSRVLILCGPGNNGGDGFVVARHLHNGGVAVVVALAAPRDKVQGDAATNLSIYSRLGDPLLNAYESDGFEAARGAAQQADVIVDALLGTGSTGAPRGKIAELVTLANAAPRARRLAIDIPSGLDGDTGEVAEPCFRADATVTFVAAKQGFSTEAARSVLGRVVVVGIGTPIELIPGRKNPGRGA